MKNFLILLLLLVVSWFVFLFLEPEHDLSQKVFGYLNITVSKNVEVEVDLTDCISYFDWCNTCMVEDWEIKWCTRMFCDTTEEPRCLEYKWTWMDLTNCLSYFDGCNTCEVKNGEISLCTEISCEEYQEAKCTQYVSDVISSEDEIDTSSVEAEIDLPEDVDPLESETVE